jgi:hypothetical protein
MTVITVSHVIAVVCYIAFSGPKRTLAGPQKPNLTPILRSVFKPFNDAEATEKRSCMETLSCPTTLLNSCGLPVIRRLAFVVPEDVQQRA